jgi:hypothetical protein
MITIRFKIRGQPIEIEIQPTMIIWLIFAVVQLIHRT